MSEKMKSLSLEEAIAILSDMKIDITVPKAAVTQRKRNAALDMAISALSCSEIPNSSDHIRRQTAIEALRAIKHGLWEIDIPSPTVPEYVEHHEQIKNMMEIVDGWIKRIKEEPAANLWIPCKKKLPDKYGFYLVTLNNATTDFCLWNAMEFGWEASGIFNKCDEVTAWMPLPEPYTKEDEDDTVN